MSRLLSVLALLASVALPHPNAPPPLAPAEVAAVQRAITAAADVAPNARRTPVVVVPHHLVAAHSVAAALAHVRGQPFTRVLLLTPDHFDACDALLCTTDEALPSLEGAVPQDQDALAVLRASPLVRVVPELFHREHGARDVAPFVHAYLPEARVVPVAFAQTRAWEVERGAIAQLLASLDDGRTLLVASTDASHGLDLAAATAADRVTLTALLADDLDGIRRLATPSQTDCPPCLWIAALRARELGATIPTVVSHTNSAVLLGDVTALDTTSHLAVVFATSDVGADAVAVAGDVTVARGVPDACMPPVLTAFWEGAAVRVATLEGPIRSACPARAHPYVFCNDRRTFGAVAPLATHWSIVSNHAVDGGATVGQTVAELAALGRAAVADEPVIAGNVRLLSATSVVNGEGGGRDETSVRRAIATLERDPRPELLTVVLLHAGVEFDPELPPADDALARALVDAGADAVLVSHSHVLGDVTFHRGRPIVRGLGNALFDQFDAVATRTARVVRLGKDASGAVRVAVRTGELERGASRGCVGY